MYGTFRYSGFFFRSSWALFTIGDRRNRYALRCEKSACLNIAILDGDLGERLNNIVVDLA